MQRGTELPKHRSWLALAGLIGFAILFSVRVVWIVRQKSCVHEQVRADEVMPFRWSDCVSTIKWRESVLTCTGRHWVEVLFPQWEEGRWVFALLAVSQTVCVCISSRRDLLFSLPSRVTRADCGCWRTLRVTYELGVIFFSPVF